MKPTTYNIEDLPCETFAQGGGSFEMVLYTRFREESGGMQYAHRHNYYMILIPTKGSGGHMIDFKGYEIHPQRIFLMSPGMIHAWEANQDLEGYLIFFTAEFFSRRYHNNNLFEFPFFSTSYGLPYVDLEPQAHQQLVQLSELMLQEYHSGAEDRIKSLRSYLNIVLLHCKRSYRPTGLEPAGSSDQHGRLVVHNFLQLIDTHFQAKHLVKEYAELLHLSPNYLNVVCKEWTDKSAGELIRERIMLEAKRMLAHEAMTIAEVGYHLHFQDNAYFSRFFKKYAGVSPDKFRKALLMEKELRNPSDPQPKPTEKP